VRIGSPTTSAGSFAASSERLMGGGAERSP
jgi:hypothetical protein